MRCMENVRPTVPRSLSNPEIPDDWRARLANQLTRGHKRRALRFLDRMMDQRWPPEPVREVQRTKSKGQSKEKV